MNDVAPPPFDDPMQACPRCGNPEPMMLIHSFLHGYFCENCEQTVYEEPWNDPFDILGLNKRTATVYKGSTPGHVKLTPDGVDLPVKIDDDPDGSLYVIDPVTDERVFIVYA